MKLFPKKLMLVASLGLSFPAWSASTVADWVSCEAQLNAAMVQFQRALVLPLDTALQQAALQQAQGVQTCVSKLSSPAAVQMRQQASYFQQALQQALSQLGREEAVQPLRKQFQDARQLFSREEERLLGLYGMNTAYRVARISADLRLLEQNYLLLGQGRVNGLQRGDIGKIAERVDKQMQALELLAQSRSDLRAKWKPIGATWWFTRKAAVAPGEASADFILTYQTERLIHLLQELVA